MLCRSFARTISRPFELHYNPYTQCVTVLDRPATLEHAVHEIANELAVISSAIRKMDSDTRDRDD